MKGIRRIISFVLVLVMVIGMVPSVAVRAEETEPAQAVTEAAGAIIEPTESATDSVEEETELAEAVTEATEETIVPAEAVADTKEVPSVSTEATTEPTEETVAIETFTKEITLEVTGTVTSESVNAVSEEIAATSGTCGPALTWNFDKSSATLTISGTGVMEDYSSGEQPWHDISGSILSIEIEVGVTSIGEYAFVGCYYMTSVTMPNTITSIGEHSFRGCRSLVTVNLPDNLAILGKSAFEGCKGLASVVIPGSVTAIGVSAFEDCTGLAEVTVQNGVSSIASNAFYGCDNLKTVSLPDRIETIDAYAFRDCQSLVDIILPRSVITIGSGVFYDCESLTEMVIPDSVTDMGSSVFCGCTNLVSVEIGCNVPEIAGSAFSGCQSLTTVKFSDSIVSIGHGAFRNCTSLTDVYFDGTERYWNRLFLRGANEDGNEGLVSAEIWFGKEDKVSFNGGNGTESSPYLVATAAQLNAIHFDLKAHYVQTADVDLEGMEWEPIGYWDADIEDGSISEDDIYHFEGSFNGNDYKIFNMCITEISDKHRAIGLFGYNKGSLTKIVLENTRISVHISEGDLDGIVSGWHYYPYICVGGIVGHNTGEISDCSTAGSISVKSNYDIWTYVGGIVGLGSCSSCINYAKINASASMDNLDCGGIVGYPGTINEVIERCVNYGDIVASTYNDEEYYQNRLCCGGITGSDGSLHYCVNFGEISGTIYWNDACISGYCYVGGLSGHNTAGYRDNYENHGSFNCINFGDVYADTSDEDVRCDAGGLFGHLGGEATNCYNLAQYVYADAHPDYIEEVYYSWVGRICGNKGTLKKECYAIDTTRLGAATPKYNELEYGVILLTKEQIYDAIADILTLLGLTILEDEEVVDNVSIRYFYSWDQDNNIAYFDSDPEENPLNFGSQVTEETDMSFLANADELVGTYVLVETKSRTDGMLLPDTLISIKPVETKIGIVTALSTTDGAIAIDGTEYFYTFELMEAVPEVGDTVRYYLYEGKLISYEILEDTSVMSVQYLNNWDEGTRTVTFGRNVQSMAVVPENTDDSVLYVLDSLLGKYVLVEINEQDGVYELINIVPIESVAAVVEHVSSILATITVGGEEYHVSSVDLVSNVKAEDYVLCHIYGGEVIAVEILQEFTGKLMGWNKETQEINIALGAGSDVGALSFSLSYLASNESTEFLNNLSSGETTIVTEIQFVCDEQGFVYLVEAYPIAQATFNNHRYEIYDYSMTWTEAKEYCENLGGHLVTITSAEEQTFIEKLLPEPCTKKQYWLGMLYENNVYHWITDEDVSYTNWDPYQPDKSVQNGEMESYIHILNAKNPTLANGRRYAWNDMFVDNVFEGEENFFNENSVGLICEYDNENSSSTVNRRIRQLHSWDEISKIAYFGLFDIVGAQVTEETDTSFPKNVEELVGQYVLVSSRPVKYPGNPHSVYPDVLLSMYPVETKNGTVTSIAEETISFEEETYLVSSGVDLSEIAVGDTIQYHVYDGEIVGIGGESEIHNPAGNDYDTQNGSNSTVVGDNCLNISCDMLGDEYYNLEVSVSNRQADAYKTLSDNEMQACTVSDITVEVTLPYGLKFSSDDSRVRTFTEDILALGDTVSFVESISATTTGYIPVHLVLLVDRSVVQETDIGILIPENETATVTPSGDSDQTNQDMAERANKIELEEGAEASPELTVTKGQNVIVPRNRTVEIDTLTVEGDMTVETGGVLNVKKLVVRESGWLTVIGELNVETSLEMKSFVPHMDVHGTVNAPNAQVAVKDGVLRIYNGIFKAGTFAIKNNGFIEQTGGVLVIKNQMEVSSEDTSTFTAGTLWLEGDFKQSWHNSNFQASGDHSAVKLNAWDKDNISFATFANKDVFFNNLYIEESIAENYPSYDLTELATAHIKGDFCEVSLDYSNYSYKVVKDSDLDPQHAFELEMQELFRQEIEIALGNSQIKNGLSDAEYVLFERAVETWIMMLQTELVQSSIDKAFTEWNYIELQFDDAHIVVCMDSLYVGAQGFSSLFWYGNVGDALYGKDEKQELGMTTSTNLGEFYKQAQNKLKKAAKKEILNMLSLSIGAKVGEMVTELVKFSLRCFKLSENLAKLDEKILIQCNAIKTYNDLPDIGRGFALGVQWSMATTSFNSISIFSEELDIIEIPANNQMCISTENIAGLGDNAEQPVVFADEMLEGILCTAMGKSADYQITYADAQTLLFLNLSNYQLYSLKGLEAFTNLKSLNLSGNNFYDLSPLVGLTQLEKLDISKNRIKDLSPISNLTSLTELSVANNLITDLSALESMNNLSKLELQHNPVGTMAPIAKLTALTQLNISGVDLSAGLNYLSSLANLSVLVADDCGLRTLDGLQGTSLEYLSIRDNLLSTLGDLNCKQLLWADLKGNMLTDIFALESAEKLKTLRLSGNNLNDSAASALTAATAMEVLDISANQITCLAFVEGQPSLQQLDVSANPLTDLSGLADNGNLYVLKLESCKLEDAYIQAMTGLTGLAYLHMKHNNLTDASFLAQMPGLVSADLSSNYVDSSTVPEDQISITDVSAATKTVKSLMLAAEKEKMLVGGSMNISCYIYPALSENTDLFWSSSDTSVATVSEYGAVEAVSEGTVIITATSTNGKTAEIQLKVCQENRLTIDSESLDNQTAVWIDGEEHAVQTDGCISYVDLPDDKAETMIAYTYHVDDASDVHSQYPIGMKVWNLKNEDGIYTATREEELDNILQYSGSCIRVTGKQGIRMITSIEKSKKNSLISDGLAGYTLKEYGTVVAWESRLDDSNPLVLGQPYAMSNYAYKKGIADPVFAYDGDLMQYTNVLVGFSDAQCKEDLSMRPYMILQDTEGNEITLYGGIVTRSIGYIALRNKDIFAKGTDAYNYVWDIIRSVYGDAYDEVNAA